MQGQNPPEVIRSNDSGAQMALSGGLVTMGGDQTPGAANPLRGDAVSPAKAGPKRREQHFRSIPRVERDGRQAGQRTATPK